MNKYFGPFAHLPFWLTTISVVMLLTVTLLVQDGMFMDSILYSAVAHNQALGIGSFWFPYFDEINVATLSSFHEQPPLVFGIQKIFFLLLGDSMYVERFYTGCTLFLTAYLMVRLWRYILVSNPELQSFGWWPVLLWITVPVCFWSYSNNMHENTMGIFTLLAILFLHRAMTQLCNTMALILASICIVLAVLSKGMPGFFPLSVPLLYGIIFHPKKLNISFKQTGFLVAIIAVIGALLALYPPALKSITIYVTQRLWMRILHQHSVDSRWFILFRLMRELMPMMFVTLALFIYANYKKINVKNAMHFRLAFYFFGIGLLGSLPLMLTKVQNGFYFVPCLPFMAIGFALLNIKILEFVLIDFIHSQKIFQNLIGACSLILFGVLIFICTRIGKTSRDVDILHDVHLIGKTFAKKSGFEFQAHTMGDWSFRCYLMRYYSMNSSTSTKQWVILEKNKTQNYDLQECSINRQLNVYAIFKRTSNKPKASP